MCEYQHKTIKLFTLFRLIDILGPVYNIAIIILIYMYLLWVLCTILSYCFCPFFRYHIATFLSQVITFSRHLIPPTLKSAVFDFLKEFLDTTSPEVLSKAEVEQQYVWATFLPYIKMVYAPSRKGGAAPVDTGLHDMSTEVAVLALENMLGRENLRTVLIKENLLDFVTCLPWYTCGRAQRRAVNLVRMLHQAPDVPLQLPSLLSIARAVIAKEFCGLTKVLNSSILDLITEVARSQWTLQQLFDCFIYVKDVVSRILSLFSEFLACTQMRTMGIESAYSVHIQ